MTTPLAPRDLGVAGMTGRAALIAAIIVVAAAALPLLLSNYQVGLATEVLIFGISGDVDRYPRRLCRAHLAWPWRALRRLHLVVVYATTHAGLPPAVAFAAGVLAATVVAAIFGLLRGAHLRCYFLLLTLALA